MTGERPFLGELLQPVVRLLETRRRAHWKPGFIGFELSHEKLHMVQMEWQPGGQRIRAAVSLPFQGGRQELLNNPKALRALVKEGLRKKPFIGNKIVTCVPIEQLKLLMINYRCNSSEGEVQALLKATRERISGDLQEWVVDYLPIRSQINTETEKVALVALTKKAHQQVFLDTLSKAGLHTEALEIGPVAIRRLVCSIPSDSEHANNLVINVGRNNSYITVFSGNRLLLDRSVTFGEEQAIKRIMQQLDFDERNAMEVLYEYGISNATMVVGSDEKIGAEEISVTLSEILRPIFLDLQNEIRQALIYFASQSRGASIDQVFLLGSAARWPGSAEVLGQLLNLPIEILNPFTAFEATSDSAVISDLDPIAGIATATGCALRGAVNV